MFASIILISPICLAYAIAESKISGSLTDQLNTNAVAVGTSNSDDDDEKAKKDKQKEKDEGGHQTIQKTTSGLVLFDSLTNGNFNSHQLQANNPNGWVYSGSAVAQNAPINYFEDKAQGLHLGVQAVADGQFAGFFAVTPHISAQLHHAVLTMPYSAISDHSFNTGLYVQTSNGLINYVTCAASVSPSGILWEIVHATGNFTQATKFETLWSEASSQAHTRDCTIVTNGDNFLQVYLDHKLVYSSNSLDLQMPSPFNVFLEVQTSTKSKMLFATYKDFYSTASPEVSIAGAPAGGTVKIMHKGSAIATGSVNSEGRANIDLGKFHFPLSGSIKVFNDKGKLDAKTKGDISIWGGDTFVVTAKESKHHIEDQDSDLASLDTMAINHNTKVETMLLVRSVN